MSTGKMPVRPDPDRVSTLEIIVYGLAILVAAAVGSIVYFLVGG